MVESEVDRLRQENKELLRLVQSLSEVIFSASLEGTLTFVNQAWCDIFGHSRDEVIGCNIREFLSPTSQSKLPEFVNNKENIELEVQGSDGRSHWMLLRFRIRDENVVIGIMSDITELKDMKAQTKSYEISLDESHSKLEALSRSNARFVPNEFIRLLGFDSIIDCKLGARVSKEMAVLFLDIRGFSSISEHLKPDQIFALINEFLGCIGPQIRSNGGIIDKYMGDGVMAVFPKKAENAIQAALDIDRALWSFNNERRMHHLPILRVGIGIHMGKVQAGIIGDEERLDGTVISDAVNVAARLEDLTRNFGGGILVSQPTLDRCEETPTAIFRPLGSLEIRGRIQPMPVVQIFRLDDPLAPSAIDLESFSVAVQAAEEGNMEEAVALLWNLRQTSPMDRTVQNLESRVVAVMDTLRSVQKSVEPFYWMKGLPKRYKK